MRLRPQKYFVQQQSCFLDLKRDNQSMIIVIATALSSVLLKNISCQKVEILDKIL